MEAASEASQAGNEATEVAAAVVEVEEKVEEEEIQQCSSSTSTPCQSTSSSTASSPSTRTQDVEQHINEGEEERKGGMDKDTGSERGQERGIVTTSSWKELEAEEGGKLGYYCTGSCW